MISDEELLEETRTLIMEALATYQPSKSNDGSERAIFNVGSTKRVTNDNERPSEPLSATSSRRKGSSKLNCSEDVFEHLRVQRTIKKLPTHLAKWLIYRYGENPSTSLVPSLVNVVVDELPLDNCRKPTKQKVRTMLVERLTRREFVDCLQRNLFEAIGVSEQAYYMCYAKHNNSITEQFNVLDKLALRAFCVLHNTQN
ncbi:hypothetical protein SO574_23265 (plasmid) [Vibrio alfacsensis]|uniref:hypothetical protein n=1 Tax=Vibrio alfacsensis TaxID=1074311 RepID=UPI002ADE1566|nr:hypothetical protein [Vibrio alfacsensis]WQE79404.1 hypothetical protein SO574_23265 [Vibrio alfacsensis]